MDCGASYRQETATSPVNLGTDPFGIGPATSTIHQGTWDESHLCVPQVTGRHTNLVSAVSPKAIHGLAPVFLQPRYGNNLSKCLSEDEWINKM